MAQFQTELRHIHIHTHTLSNRLVVCGDKKWYSLVDVWADLLHLQFGVFAAHELISVGDVPQEHP